MLSIAILCQDPYPIWVSVNWESSRHGTGSLPSASDCDQSHDFSVGWTGWHGQSSDRGGSIDGFSMIEYVWIWFEYCHFRISWAFKWILRQLIYLGLEVCNLSQRKESGSMQRVCVPGFTITQKWVMHPVSFHFLIALPFIWIIWGRPSCPLLAVV